MDEQTELFPDDPAPSPTRKDHAFEALCEVWGADWTQLTRDQRGRVNAALAQLRELHVDLESYELSILIRARAKNWSAHYPEITLTPQALTAHWSTLERAPAPAYSSNVVAVAFGECRECGGDRFVPYRSRPSLNPSSPYEEVAACPECNADADLTFRRADGSLFHPAKAGTSR